MRIVSYELHLTWRFLIMFDLSTVSTRYLFQPSTVTNLPHAFFCKPMNLLMVPDMCAWGTLGCSEQKGVLRNQELHSKWSLRDFPWLLVHNAGHGTHVCTWAKTPVVASKGANLVQSWRKRWMKAYVSKPWKTLAFATIQTAIRNDNSSRVERKTMKSSPIIVKDWRFRALSIDLIWVNCRPRKLCPRVAISNGCHPSKNIMCFFFPGRWYSLYFTMPSSRFVATSQTATLWMLAWYSSKLYPTASWFGSNIRST